MVSGELFFSLVSFFRLKDILPKEYVKLKGVEKKIFGVSIISLNQMIFIRKKKV